MSDDLTTSSMSFKPSEDDIKKQQDEIAKLLQQQGGDEPDKGPSA